MKQQSSKQEKEKSSIKKILKSSEEDGDPLSVLWRAFTFSWSVGELVDLSQSLISEFPQVVFIFNQIDETRLVYVFSVSSQNDLIGPGKEKIVSDLSQIVQVDGNVVVTRHTDGFVFERKVSANEYGGKILDELSGNIFSYLRTNKLLLEEDDEADQFLDFDNF